MNKLIPAACAGLTRQIYPQRWGSLARGCRAIAFLFLTSVLIFRGSSERELTGWKRCHPSLDNPAHQWAKIYMRAGVDVKRIPEMGTSLSIGGNCAFPCKLFLRREIINFEKCPDGVGQNDILNIEG
jgi:hypothetical protein